MARIVADYEILMAAMSTGHTSELLEVGITMGQAKALFVLTARHEMHMSALAAELGISLSTCSGLVERLVEQELVERHHDPGDRRHVVVRVSTQGAALVDRFRELNGQRLAWLLQGLDLDDLAALARVISLLGERAASIPPDHDLDPRHLRTAQ